jgi:hypothetical protein
MLIQYMRFKVLKAEPFGMWCCVVLAVGTVRETYYLHQVKARGSFKVSLRFSQTTWNHISEGSNLHWCRRFLQQCSPTCSSVVILYFSQHPDRCCKFTDSTAHWRGTRLRSSYFWRFPGGTVDASIT